MHAENRMIKTQELVLESTAQELQPEIILFIYLFLFFSYSLFWPEIILKQFIQTKFSFEP